MTCSSSINIPSYLLCAQTIVSCGVLGAFLEVCLVPVSGWNPALSINRACMHIPICHLGPYAWTVSCSCAVAYYMHPVIAHWKVSVSNQYALPLLTIRYQILSACPEGIVGPALQHWRLVFWMLAHFWSSIIAAACSESHSTCNISKQIEQPECLVNFFVGNSSSEVTARNRTLKLQEDSRAALQGFALKLNKQKLGCWLHSVYGHVWLEGGKILMREKRCFDY